MKPESKVSKLSKLSRLSKLSGLPLIFLLGLVTVAAICSAQRMETAKSSNAPARSTPMDENQESIKNVVQIDVEILTRPVRRSVPCMVNVRLTNKAAKPVLMNRRLSVGYKTSQSRELYFEIYRKGAN